MSSTEEQKTGAPKMPEEKPSCPFCFSTAIDVDETYLSWRCRTCGGSFRKPHYGERPPVKKLK
jgi:ribosomal protein L37AE/L43A